MSIPFYDVSSTRKLEITILFGMLLFIFKVTFGTDDSVLLLVFDEILVLGASYFLTLYIIDYIDFRNTSPLTMILNAGILAALIFFMISSTSVIFDSPSDVAVHTGFINSIVFTLVFFVIAGAVLYIFAVLRGLFFLRQKRDPKRFFNFMTILMLCSAAAGLLYTIDNTLDYIFYGVYTMSIVLIVVNSVRVSWIAFLTKKQKIYLLIISVILSALFGINYSLSLEDSITREIMIRLSPALGTFLNLVMIYGSIYFGVIFFTTLFHLPTAEAFDRKEEEVSSLIDLSRLLTRVFDRKELADTITQMTIKVSNADSAWLLAESEGRMEILSVANIGYVEADKITGELKSSLPGENEDVRGIERAGLFSKLKVNREYRSIVIAPLKLHGENTGYLFAARREDYIFDTDDKRAIGAYAQYAALAMENSKLIEESIEKERLEKELDVAREIQYKILPNETPECPVLDISALFIPAFEVGGDYYDFFRIDEKRLGFVVADVSGKGISAAFVMAEVKGVFESLAGIIAEPAKLLTAVNNILTGSLDAKTFVTAIYGVFDKTSGRFVFARAGHNPLLLVKDGAVERLTPPGLGLGLVSGNKFAETITESEIVLGDNDILILYTDGIPESQNELQEEFGLERFEDIIREHSGKGLDTISNEIVKGVTTFSKNSSQHDDITLVLFKKVFNNKNAEKLNG